MRLPEWGELVLVNVKRITPFAAWVELEEYPEVEGMIHISEVAGKWVRDIRKFVKLNKRYVAKVMGVDRRKNFVKLSLKRVSKFDEKEKMNEYRRQKRSEAILAQAAKRLGASNEEKERIAEQLIKKYGSLFSAFEAIKEGEVDIPKKWYEEIRKIVDQTTKKKEHILKAELKLFSLESDGVEKVKEVLLQLEKATGGQIRYLSAPKYRLEVATKDPKTTERKMKEAMDSIIKSLGGSYEMVK
jgi:translation initiation factor 2 subunit 1